MGALGGSRAVGVGRAFGELRLGAALALLWLLCGKELPALSVPREGKLRQAAPGAAPLASVEDWQGSRGHVWVLLKVRAPCTPGAGCHSWGPPEGSPRQGHPPRKPHTRWSVLWVYGAARVTQTAPPGFQGLCAPTKEL